MMGIPACSVCMRADHDLCQNSWGGVCTDCSHHECDEHCEFHQCTDRCSHELEDHIEEAEHGITLEQDRHTNAA